MARHARSLVAHRTVTDPAHAASARALREARRGLGTALPEPEVELRDLAAYDRALGVIP